MALTMLTQYTRKTSENTRSNTDMCDDDDDPSCSNDNSASLHQRIKMETSSANVCSVALEQKATHISDLPREVFMFILRWVVSSDLDILSLEAVSKVCRGFYLCARDPELWHTACIRTWGEGCGQLNQYDSWREMYICRPRICHNGWDTDVLAEHSETVSSGFYMLDSGQEL
ncbi:hypothetical protein HPB51_002644 [Rhipicephalus microplus]|uniref:F-box only protein 9 n=1 Tax=Rhipicephalus microplus TaxID=6941 RepID=A0A9J6DEZ1_RHIMP|nr:hypothetical protein HPB51_002644 [Rhipicephalus microplus]